MARKDYIYDSSDDEQSRGYLMDEEEVDRFQSRYSHMDVFRKVQNANQNVDDSEMRLEHCCYLQLVGKIPDYKKKQSYQEFRSEIVENYFDKAILYQNVTQLEQKREEYAVVEDDFGPTLTNMLIRGKKPSYENLVAACRKFDTDDYIQIHLCTSETSHKHFLKMGITENEARAYAFAIAFYTGTYSEMISINANLFARRWQRNKATNAENVEVDSNAAMIMYYLIKGLSHIEFYWGVSVRYVKLTDKELKDYQEGEILTWLQFSSSDKGDDKDGKHLLWFKGRNTKFIIASLTGRSIKNFSNCAEDEDEVLFLPHSTFLVCKKEYVDRKNLIYLRQIELGLCKYVVLWVDDHIFHDWWENKGHMEKASTRGAQVNVHFIPKSNTETAVIFLKSEFGKRLKNSNTFRIITDMNRENESSPSDAGVRLIAELRRRGFHQKCMIFTSDKRAARVKLDRVLKGDAAENIDITEDPDDVQNFVLFR